MEAPNKKLDDYNAIKIFSEGALPPVTEFGDDNCLMTISRQLTASFRLIKFLLGMDPQRKQSCNLQKLELKMIHSILAYELPESLLTDYQLMNPKSLVELALMVVTLEVPKEVQKGLSMRHLPKITWWRRKKWALRLIHQLLELYSYEKHPKLLVRIKQVAVDILYGHSRSTYYPPRVVALAMNCLDRLLPTIEPKLDALALIEGLLLNLLSKYRIENLLLNELERPTERLRVRQATKSRAVLKSVHCALDYLMSSLIEQVQPGQLLRLTKLLISHSSSKAEMALDRLIRLEACNYQDKLEVSIMLKQKLERQSPAEGMAPKKFKWLKICLFRVAAVWLSRGGLNSIDQYVFEQTVRMAVPNVLVNDRNLNFSAILCLKKLYLALGSKFINLMSNEQKVLIALRLATTRNSKVRERNLTNLMGDLINKIHDRAH